MPLRIAVVLPMFNEAGNVTVLMERLGPLPEQSGLDLVPLAVDDGSRDATALRLRDAQARYPFVRTVRHERNRGMAAALRTGIETALAERNAPFDAVAFMDADLTQSPED